MERKSIAPKETLGQALHRLARQACENGIEIYCYEGANGRSVEYYATSASRRGTLHRVSALSCDCSGFMSHQRCQHYAALLESIGELPPIDPEESAMRAERKELITQARATVARLNRDPKTTADWMNLQRARQELWNLVDAEIDDVAFRATAAQPMAAVA